MLPLTINHPLERDLKLHRTISASQTGLFLSLESEDTSTTVVPTKGATPCYTGFDLRSLLGDVIEMCSSRAKEKGLALTLVIPTSVPLRFKGNAPRLYKILKRLVLQASRQAGPGQLNLRVGMIVADDDNPYGQRLFISVSGSRAGAYEQGPTNTSLYGHRAYPSSRRATHAVRLGLASTKLLARGMGGTIIQEGLPQKGFAMTLDIPVHRPEHFAQQGSDTIKDNHAPTQNPSAITEQTGAANSQPDSALSRDMTPEEFAVRIRDMFERSLSSATAKMGEALEIRDVPAIARQAHSIINSAVVVRATELAELARGIEAKAMAGNDIETIKTDYQLLLAINPKTIAVSIHTPHVPK